MIFLAIWNRMNTSVSAWGSAAPKGSDSNQIKRL